MDGIFRDHFWLTMMLSAILDVSHSQKLQMVELWQPFLVCLKWLPTGKADNMLALKIDPTLLVFGFCYKFLFLNDGSHFCDFQ